MKKIIDFTVPVCGVVCLGDTWQNMMVAEIDNFGLAFLVLHSNFIAITFKLIAALLLPPTI